MGRIISGVFDSALSVEQGIELIMAKIEFDTRAIQSHEKATMSHSYSANPDQQPDALLTETARYVANAEIESEEAYATARWCLLDAIGCGILALQYPECA